MESAVKIYKGLIEPYFNYCSPVWDGLTKYSSEKLQKLQNRAARVITKSTFDASSDLVLEALHWDKLSISRKKHIATLMYKTINSRTPTYLQELFTERTSIYNLRDLENKLFIPKPRTDYLKRSFSYSGAFLWNSLPAETRSARSLNSFKKGIDTWFSSPDSHTAIIPAELLFNRPIRNKLPSFATLQHDKDDNAMNEEVQQRDKKEKKKIKDFADKRNNAKECQLQVGYRVLVQVPKSNKLSMPFNIQPYRVTERNGSMVTAQNADHTITRNISHFKRLTNFQHRKKEEEHDDEEDNYDGDEEEQDDGEEQEEEQVENEQEEQEQEQA